VPVPHSDGSTGYVLSKDSRSVGIFLDCGHITPAIAQAVDGLNVLAVESNYSQSMMAQSHYDEELKKRLMAGTGHLSNDDVAELLRHHRGTKLHTVVLLHLSRHTNLPALAEQAAALALNGRNVRVLVAQDIPITVEV
jgi:phosphoribosyl 1,2-cyclic phosphodiesterase